MTPPGSNAGFPLLSVLIFAPLLGAAVAALLRRERGRDQKRENRRREKASHL